jgi:hypothetical protein
MSLARPQWQLADQCSMGACAPDPSDQSDPLLRLKPQIHDGIYLKCSSHSHCMRIGAAEDMMPMDPMRVAGSLTTSVLMTVALEPAASMSRQNQGGCLRRTGRSTRQNLARHTRWARRPDVPRACAGVIHHTSQGSRLAPNLSNGADLTGHELSYAVLPLQGRDRRRRWILRPI